MANMGLFSGIKSSKPLTNSVKSLNVKFRIPYYTHWGQSLLVCGSEPVLGSWDLKKGFLLSPVHQDDELMWCGSIAVPIGFSCEYSYYVVDDKKNVLRWEMGKKRKLLLYETIKDGEVVELHDLWQTGGDALPFRNAFKNVIFRRSCSLNIERSEGLVHNKLEQDDSVLARFKICIPNIEEDTSVYVIGSTSILGQWKLQNALKLSYVGESIWEAVCVMQRGDFPLKYRYCKSGKTGNVSLEIGANRNLTVDFSNNQPRYIFLSDGMFRVDS